MLFQPPASGGVIIQESREEGDDVDLSLDLDLGVGADEEVVALDHEAEGRSSAAAKVSGGSREGTGPTMVGGTTAAPPAPPLPPTAGQRAFAAAMKRMQRMAAEVKQQQEAEAEAEAVAVKAATTEAEKRAMSGARGPRGPSNGGVESRVPVDKDLPAEVVEMSSRCRPLGQLLSSEDVWSMSR